MGDVGGVGGPVARTGVGRAGSVESSGLGAAKQSALNTQYRALSEEDRAAAAKTAPRFQLETFSAQTEALKPQVEALAKKVGGGEWGAVRRMRDKPGADQQALANLDRYYYVRDRMRDAVNEGSLLGKVSAAGIGVVGGLVDTAVKVALPERGRSGASLGGMLYTFKGLVDGNK